jgi:hypothetical protein
MRWLIVEDMRKHVPLLLRTRSAAEVSDLGYNGYFEINCLASARGAFALRYFSFQKATARRHANKTNTRARCAVFEL